MDYGYIYKTTNLINGRIYIGQHKGTIKLDYLGSGVLINRAINKYGRNNFRIEILAYATNSNMLDGLEMKLIYEYREVYGKEFLYNLTDGGDGCKGLERTKEHKNAISVAIREAHNKGLFLNIKRGQPCSQESRNKISQSNKGKKRTEEVKLKLSEIHKKNGTGKWRKGCKQSNNQKQALLKTNIGNKYRLGHKHSEETKIKMSLARIGKKYAKTIPCTR